jgi:hypothetical protein
VPEQQAVIEHARQLYHQDTKMSIPKLVDFLNEDDMARAAVGSQKYVYKPVPLVDRQRYRGRGWSVEEAHGASPAAYPLVQVPQTDQHGSRMQGAGHHRHHDDSQIRRKHAPPLRRAPLCREPAARGDKALCIPQRRCSDVDLRPSRPQQCIDSPYNGLVSGLSKP